MQKTFTLEYNNPDNLDAGYTHIVHVDNLNELRLKFRLFKKDIPNNFIPNHKSHDPNCDWLDHLT